VVLPYHLGAQDHSRIEAEGQASGDGFQQREPIADLLLSMRARHMSGNLSDDSQPQNDGGTFRANDASESAICSGARFGNYLVRELIGVGNTASIYRAHDTRLLREVALKVLNTAVLAGAEGLARFLHEARMAAAVRHPNVVSLFDVGVQDGTPYIVMELLAGEALDGRLNAARHLPEPVLIDIASQLVRGLTAVHDAGVVHRDLKPSNVFLARGPEGSTQAKLLDFGISKQTRDNLRLTTNGRRRWAAMPLYTAPEVLRDGEATFLSDQYSLGVLLYECVTGINPFRADTLRESIDRITAGQARRINDQARRPSRRLAALIERAMSFYPHERFADSRELGRALAAASARRTWWGWSSRPDPSGVPRPSSRPWKSRQSSLGPGGRSGRRLGSVIGATVLACSIAAPVVAWWSVRRHRAMAPVTVTSSLALGEVRATLPAPATSISCATPCPAPASASPSAPARDNPAPASTAPLATSTQAGSLQTSALQARSLQAGSLTPVFAATSPPTQFVAPAAMGEAAPAADAPEPVLPVPGAPEENRVGGVLRSPDGGVLDAGDAVEVPASSVAPTPSGPDRGTNGAFIFD
jgi:eukaryotic-like serine/threonine-protein kinase